MSERIHIFLVSHEIHIVYSVRKQMLQNFVLGLIGTFVTETVIYFLQLSTLKVEDTEFEFGHFQYGFFQRIFAEFNLKLAFEFNFKVLLPGDDKNFPYACVCDTFDMDVS